MITKVVAETPVLKGPKPTPLMLEKSTKFKLQSWTTFNRLPQTSKILNHK